MFFSIFGYGSPSVASSDAYDSGRDHDCDDANISDRSDRYINKPGKGPSFHTGAFMDGYYAGLNACSSSSAGTNGDNDDNDNDEKPYCDEVGPGYRGTCFDSQDYDDTTGLYPCKDGSQVTDWRNCTDDDNSNSNKLKVIQKTTVIPSATATAVMGNCN